MPLNSEAAEPANTEEPGNEEHDNIEEQEDLLDDDADKNSSAADRLNAIVGAATFLSNADPNYKDQMVEIVKKEFINFTGYVSTNLASALSSTLDLILQHKTQLTGYHCLLLFCSSIVITVFCTYLLIY